MKRPRSLRSKINVYFITMLIVILGIFSLAITQYFKETFRENAVSNGEQIVGQSISTMDTYFSHLKKIIQVLGSNENILKAVEYRNSVDEVDYKYELGNKWTVEYAMQNAIGYNYDIKDIIIIGKDGNALYHSGGSIRQDYNFWEQNWFPSIQDDYAIVNFSGLHAQDYYFNKTDEQTISMFIPVKDYRNVHKNYNATLMFNFYVDKMFYSGDLSFSHAIIVVDSQDNIVWDTSNGLNDEQMNQLKQQLTDDKGSFIVDQTDSNTSPYSVVYDTSRITGWKNIGLKSLDEVDRHIHVLMMFSLYSVLATIAAVLISSMIISKSITKPITKLAQKFKRIPSESLDVDLYDDSTKEILILSTTANKMIQKLHDLNLEVLLEQASAKDAQVRALQHQINPHFLNNTLQNIKALALSNDSQAISEISTILGKMLTYSIYQPYEMVELHREIHHAENFIKIQMYRYPGMFDYEVACPEDLASVKVPKLILQPIVENAIQHGILKKGHGYIVISIQEEQENIFISVIDNGGGISTERQEQLQNELKHNQVGSKSSSIGLANIHERVKITYGGHYGIRITSEYGKHTTISIVIPK
ncbi:two-component system sensor histidine kinase YesM [Paenibacillus anaericanus]|uniref:sensor histidine kinase n=1 Tax=Paenibacillus anaericanus TaxID=170367 RepID=UPI002786FEC5|nr:histidine kinase [Paenibacillus anaericanus]MDQ0089498.1 two-component system sensor histidine kinase YesM [Paenibacillus anaericanus]